MAQTQWLLKYQLQNNYLFKLAPHHQREGEEPAITHLIQYFPEPRPKATPALNLDQYNKNRRVIPTRLKMVNDMSTSVKLFLKHIQAGKIVASLTEHSNFDTSNIITSILILHLIYQTPSSEFCVCACELAYCMQINPPQNIKKYRYNIFYILDNSQKGMRRDLTMLQVILSYPY